MDNYIETLLPHRAPFLFVDEIVSANKDEIIALKTFNKEDNPAFTGSFPGHDIIPGMMIIESMAQSGGAGIKQQDLAEGFFGLVGISDVRFIKGVYYDEQIKYIVRNLRISNLIIKQTGVAYCNNEPVAEATWTCARID